MKKLSSPLLPALALGLVGGVVRAFELRDAFDPATQLLRHWHWTTVLLAAITVAAALLSVILSLGKGAPEQPEAKTSAPALAGILLAGALLAALAVFDGTDLIRYVIGSGLTSWSTFLSKLTYILLTLFSVASLVVVRQAHRAAKPVQTCGFFYTVIVFWCCFTLVLDFWGHAANPVLGSFFYSMFSIIFLTLALYGVAGFFFKRRMTVRSLAFCSLGAFFSVLSLLSLLLYPLLGNNELTLTAAQFTPQTLLRLAFSAVLLSVLAAMISRGAFARIDEAPSPEKTPEDFPPRHEDGGSDADLFLALEELDVETPPDEPEWE